MNTPMISKTLMPLPARRNWSMAGALLACALWGSAFPAVKAGLVYWPPIFFAGARFTLAGLAVLLPAAGRFRSSSLRGHVKAVLMLGLIQTVIGYALFFRGLKNAAAVSGAIINSTGPIMVAILARFTLGERGWTPARLVGLVCGLVGIVLASLGPGWRPAFAWDGEGLLLLSTLIMAYGSILAKRLTEAVDPVLVSALSMLSGGLALLILAALTEPLGIPAHEPAALALLLYTAFLSAAAFTVWYILLRYNPVSALSSVKFTIPVFGIVLAALFLGEKPTLFDLAGGSLVVLGIILLFRKGRQGKSGLAEREEMPISGVP